MQSTTRAIVMIIAILMTGFIAGGNVTAQDGKFGAADTIISINDFAKFYNARILQVDIEAEKTKARLEGEFNAFITRRAPGDSSKVIVPRSLFR